MTITKCNTATYFMQFTEACFKRRILHASNSIVSIMFMLSATSETIKFDVSNCGRPKL